MSVPIKRGGRKPVPVQPLKVRLTLTQYRVDATGFQTRAEAEAAMAKHKAYNPDDIYSVRQYRGEGFFVLVQFSNGGSRWLRTLTEADCRAFAQAFNRAIGLKS